MRPSEFFFFNSSKYRMRMSTQSTQHLLARERQKQVHLSSTVKCLPVNWLLVLATHGTALLLVAISHRSIEVANEKLDIIRSELRERNRGGRGCAKERVAAVLAKALADLDDDEIRWLTRALNASERADGQEEKPNRQDVDVADTEMVEDAKTLVEVELGEADEKSPLKLTSGGPDLKT
ncbi:hypothetical protein NA57DRAFT_61154 [Rhizodiscina lignyota]|uniref:Uncharacterized protein n=1 Tax=Rhizodiscina lignyota TaxID=1504668 RepID=A0A9P4M5L2_9PEZI|nr:hypothetical protein NA57DRAFT_61154 [Rhizodiscina lignyota]